MKQTLYFLNLLFLMFTATAVIAQPANDVCTSAQSLGTLPAPAACNGSTNIKSGTPVVVSGTNASATPENPYPYINTCGTPSTTNPPADVWYSFVASSYQATIRITGASFANPIVSVYEGSCTALLGVGCAAGTGGTASVTIVSLTPGNTYYIQVAGPDGSQTGTFTLHATSQTDCANCLTVSSVTATPPPVNGTYGAGVTVTFCDFISSWNQTSSNWLHGVVPTFGSGWDLTTLVPGAGPTPCTTGGTWSWYPSGQTSSATGNTYGPGFYFETASGNANNTLDNDPGNNYGDNDPNNTCSWNFCVTITTNASATCTPGSDLDVTFATTGDGESGSWTSLACTNDPVTDLYIVGACCPPTMTSTPATCANPTSGTATATPTGTNPPYTYTWSTGTVMGPQSTASTITGIAAGTYTVSVVDATNCTATASVTVSGPSANAGPSQTVTCATLPGGSATMAAVGTGTWTAQAGNPGTATITTPGSAATTITNFSTAGTYIFVWTVSGCTDTATVTVTAKPNAGPDKTLSCVAVPGGSVTMSGTGTGTWTAQTGNPGTATITTAASPTTTITTFSAAGTYHFIFTNGTCTDTANVTVTAKPNAGPDKTVTCFPSNSSATMAATGIGTWTAQAGNPGTATITTPTSPTTTITAFSAAGTYNFIWTNGGCTDTAAVIVTAKPNAGPDQTVTCFPANSSATMAATGTGTWTAQTGNPGTATITTPTSPTTTITTFSAAGTYNFIWTNGGCSDTAAVIVTTKPNAGPDKTVTCATLPGGSATMAATGTGTWTAQTGNPGTAVITTATSPTTTITTFSTAGTYNFIWSNGSCSDTAAVVVTAKPNAGPNQTITCATLPGGSATMAATGTGTWTAQTGNPGTATITAPTSPTTTITTFSAAGTYNFIWTNGNCTDTAAVVVTAKPNAGPDQTVTCATLPGGTATMAGTGTGTWTAQTGNPGTATITTPTSPTTTITTFSVAGTYNFIFTNGSCTDTASVIVTAKPNAGPDKTVSCIILPGGSATMAATGTGTWTALGTNPGTSTITSATSPTTTITTFSAAGTYNYVWTNGICSDTAAVIVTAKPNAGPDQTVTCYPLNSSASMAATGTGTWTAQTGNPGTAVITTPSSPTTTITTFSAAGTYNFIWTNGTCSDTAAVIVTTKPNAGPDKTVSCIVLPGGSATMSATGTGTWTAQLGNPGTAVITNPTSPTTTITTYSAAGTYNFIWTNGSCSDTASVVVTTKPNAGPDQTVTCVILPGGSALMAATGTGTWTAQTGNPGTSTITTPASPTTTITTFSAAGTYHYIWTNGSCTDTAAVIVTAKPNAGPDQTVNCAVLPGGSATMAATGTGTWTAQVGNPGTATITTPTSPTSSITTYSAVGTYYFIWTNASGCSDTASVTVTAKPNAGPDQTINCLATFPGGAATMAATGTGTWTAQGNNPGTSTITTPASATSTITGFSIAGTYHYIWTNGTCSDTAAVIVTAKPNAGTDQTVNCAILPGGAATMAATGTGTWTAQAGNPGTATITTATSPTSTITTFSAAGTYNFVWTNGGCSDTASITVTAKPNAGPDKTVSCIVLPGGSATMAATGTGTWSASAGNPGTSTVTTPGSATTTITTFSAAGTYNFIWTNGTCSDTAAVIVTAKSNAGPDQTVTCYPLNGGATMAATGTGTWTAQAGNPGTSTITTPGSASTAITGFSVAGTYNYVWTSGGCTDTASVVVTTKPNAGPDKTVSCALLPGGSATMAAIGTGTWTAQAGNPGTATITNPASSTTTITTYSVAGTYYFIWTNGTCSDTAVVTVTAKPDAGPDQTVTCAILPAGSATMAASGSGTWTAQAGNPGTSVITTPGSANTTITTFSAAGTYHYIWTSGGCTDTAAVVVTAKPNAGADQTVNCAILPGGSATMAATGAGTWTAQNGNPGTATITNPNSPTTTITTYSAEGTYSFIWTNASGCTDTASVTVTAKPNAGPDQTVNCVTSLPGGSATMAATGNGTWTAQVNNPGTSTITNPASSNTTITSFSAAGTYHYIWTNGTCSDTAAVIVTVKPNAGSDQTVACAVLPGGAATMGATGIGIWTAQAGNPGSATITTPGSATTTITTFSVAGTYNFIWTSGGCTDTASVIVSAKPNAGPDQNVSCVVLPGGIANMAALGTGIWTAWSGNPGTASITNPASNNTTITTFSIAGTYNFIWTNGTCSDTAAVIVTAKPDAGPDQTVTCYPISNSATMAASGIGTWTAESSNPGTSIITSTTNPSTTITNFSAVGTYQFVWTNGNCTDTASVTVIARPSAGPDQTVSCAVLPGGSATMAASGTGSWSELPGNPGLSNITNSTNANTSITTFSAPGTYYYVWASGGCIDTAAVTVTAKPDAGPDQVITCYPINNSITLGATGIGTWTEQSGNPGTVIIATPANPNTTVSGFSAAGTYYFVWTNGNCTDTTAVTVVPRPSAGPDQTVSCAVLPGGSVTMAGAGAGSWSEIPGNPGVSTITTPGSATTTITTFSTAGTYYYLWSSGGCIDTAIVTVTAKPDAGPDQTMTCYPITNSITMAAVGTGTWTEQSGNPGTVTITTATDPATTITNFSAAGTYYFVWTSGGCTDTTGVTVVPRPTAGPDQTVSCAILPGGSATMAAAAAGTGSWTEIPGNPGVSTITAPGSASTTITTFSAAGTYYYLWSSGGCIDTAAVIVTAKPDAGADQTITCYPISNSITMAASGSGTWTAEANNPGVAIIANTTDPATTISGFTAAGTYNFVWTNGGCTDTAAVTVIPRPTAGPDQNVSCVVLPGGSAAMAAAGTGSWTEIPGNPGVSTITSPGSSTTSITTFSVAGTYYYLWSSGGCIDTAAVIVTAKPDAGPDATICQYTTGSLNAVGTGIWSSLSSNPAITTILSATSASTSVTGFTVPGSYSFLWTNNGCSDTAVINVNGTPVVAPIVANITCTNATGVIYANASGAAPFTYQWSNAATADSITTLSAGTSYAVTVTDINQCSSTASASVSNQIIIVSISDSLQDITCYGYDNGRVVLYVSPAGAYTYTWSNGSSADSLASMSPGSYQVTVTDPNGCSSTASYTFTNPGVDLLSVTPLDSIMIFGDTIQLNSALTGPYAAGTYSWTPSTGLSCTDCPDPSLIPVDTLVNVYQLTVTYYNGCIVTASDTIKARPNDITGIPDAFTPNGDGKNDEFKILAKSVKEFKLTIYNRWGQQVFETTDVNQGWNGTYKGNPQPQEVYTFFYTIVFLDGRTESRQSALTLLR